MQGTGGARTNLNNQLPRCCPTGLLRAVHSFPPASEAAGFPKSSALLAELMASGLRVYSKRNLQYTGCSLSTQPEQTPQCGKSN